MRQVFTVLYKRLSCAKYTLHKSFPRLLNTVAVKVQWVAHLSHVNAVRRLQTWLTLWQLRHSFSKTRWLNIQLVWSIMPCSLSKTDRCFWGGCCLHHHSGAKRRTLHYLWATKKEIVRSSETWVVIYKSIRHHIPENSNILQERSEKLKRCPSYITQYKFYLQICHTTASEMLLPV